MEQDLYPYSPIVERPRLTWPEGKKIAFYVGLNIEHYQLDLPSTSSSPATIGLVPDPMNYGWRDYGVRVGFWRILDVLDELGLRASVPLNSDVCRFYPQIVAAGVERDWTWIGHGRSNSRMQTGFEDDDAERAYLVELTETIATATGRAPRGWLGPALTETLSTPAILRDLGYDYLLDWCNDDQPYALSLPGMYSVPYHVELNDIGAFLTLGLDGPGYQQAVEDQLEELVRQAGEGGLVMALPIHTFVSGQPFRLRWLRRALATIAAHPDVWLTTSDEILDAYLAQPARG